MNPIIAQASDVDPSLGGWYIGVAIGFAVIVVVVIIVALILDVASKINKQAQMAVEALDSAQNNTLPIWDVAHTNRTAKAVLEGAIRAREAVEDL